MREGERGKGERGRGKGGKRRGRERQRQREGRERSIKCMYMYIGTGKNDVSWVMIEIKDTSGYIRISIHQTWLPTPGGAVPEQTLQLNSQKQSTYTPSMHHHYQDS